MQEALYTRLCLFHELLHPFCLIRCHLPLQKYIQRALLYTCILTVILQPANIYLCECRRWLEYINMRLHLHHKMKEITAQCMKTGNIVVRVKENPAIAIFTNTQHDMVAKGIPCNTKIALFQQFCKP